MHGIINVNKPAGMTSHGVVARIRRISGIKKVGHTGTLDPDAEGVLPVCVGKATRLSDMLTGSDKRYTAVLWLGITTDTQDISGKVLGASDDIPGGDAVRACIGRFTGELMQVPPMYSAIKVGGKKLCDLARKGVEIERQPRKITVYGIDILSLDGCSAVLDIKCSKGTYIRTLCHDIGNALGCGGCMEKLTRTQTAGFKLEDAVTLDALEADGIEKHLIPTDELFDYDKLTVSGGDEKRVLSGAPVKADSAAEDMCYRIYGSDGRFLCISKCSKGMLTLVKSFY